jgi:hypothetical protein
MPKQGTEIDLSRERVDARVPIMDLLKRLRTEGVRITKALNKELHARFGSSIAHSEIEAVIAVIKEMKQGSSGNEGAEENRAAM